jgi:hypothetical protein
MGTIFKNLVYVRHVRRRNVFERLYRAVLIFHADRATFVSKLVFVFHVFETVYTSDHVSYGDFETKAVHHFQPWYVCLHREAQSLGVD